MTDITVLVADDDAVLRALIRDILHKEGFATIEAADGRQALDRFFGAERVDLLVLDVMMPILDGWEVLKEIRVNSDVPVLLLTALGDEGHEIAGLRLGADEFIGKPFRYAVFVARIHALLRKTLRERSGTIVLGGLVVDPGLHRIEIDGIGIEMNRKEFALLVYLLHNRNRVLTREQILDSLWGREYDGDIRTVDTHIKMLRAKLGTCGEWIRTVRGIGYRFEGEVP